MEREQGALSRLDACSLCRSGSLIPACATELLLFDAFAVPVVNLGSHSSELAKSRCRAIPVRGFPSGWDRSAKPCCAPRRRVWRDICAAGSIEPGFAQRFRRLRLDQTSSTLRALRKKKRAKARSFSGTQDSVRTSRSCHPFPCTFSPTSPRNPCPCRHCGPCSRSWQSCNRSCLCSR